MGLYSGYFCPVELYTIADTPVIDGCCWFIPIADILFLPLPPPSLFSLRRTSPSYLPFTINGMNYKYLSIDSVSTFGFGSDDSIDTAATTIAASLASHKRWKSSPRALLPPSPFHHTEQVSPQPKVSKSSSVSSSQDSCSSKGNLDDASIVVAYRTKAEGTTDLMKGKQTSKPTTLPPPIVKARLVQKASSGVGMVVKEATALSNRPRSRVGLLWVASHKH
jgi:hypothetical protein